MENLTHTEVSKTRKIEMSLKIESAHDLIIAGGKKVGLLIVKNSYKTQEVWQKWNWNTL